MGYLVIYEKEYEISESWWQALLKNSKSLWEILHENQIKYVKDFSIHPTRASTVGFGLVFFFKIRLRNRSWVSVLSMHVAKAASAGRNKTSTQGSRFFFLKRGRRREKHQIGCLCTCPNQRSNPQPKYGPWVGIKPDICWCAGLSSNRLSHPARASRLPLYAILFPFLCMSHVHITLV